MTSRESRLVAVIFLLVAVAGPVGAQAPARFDAGAGAGGSAFGWQPRVGLGSETQALSLGVLRASMYGSLHRFAGVSAAQYDVAAGARLSSAPGANGWWLGRDVVRHNGFKDAVEQPRIETGGWHRIGPVVVTISAARRSAALSGMALFTRSVTRYYAYLDSVTGHWDSTRVTRDVTDSVRVAGTHRWAESEAGLAWEGRFVSAEVTLGGRLESRDVPRAAWGSATVAVRLAAPLSLVIGAGGSSGGRLALDAEHRYVSLGFRIAPRMASTVSIERPRVPDGMVSAFEVDSVGGGRYRLVLRAPRARRVEVSGDFTGWHSVPLTRNNNGRWTLTVPLAAGTHRLNARVDGGNWIVPPGLTAMTDDYAGQVGLLVIERQADAAK
jgi:hypothetical protein